MKRNIFNRTKIIATIGPATSHPDVLERIIIEGVDVCRLNFSHSGRNNKEIIETIRKVNEEWNLHTCILADLQGPKIRLGEIENGKVEWKRGDKVIITTKECLGTKEKVYITYKEFAKDVKTDDNILVDDGKISLFIKETNGVDEVTAVVINGGMVGSKKGVNLPDTHISQPSLTEKDIADLDFVLENNVDWIALSFVRKAEDIIDLKRRIAEKGKKTFVIAKIERPEALTCIDDIIRESDGIMVARGDLGVELNMEDVPMVQKSIVKKCIMASKPVIIATQMMESMITNPRPTRAEANDVANAVLDGADALMLSAETSVGEYPLYVIESMRKIIENVEKEKSIYHYTSQPNRNAKTFYSDAICMHAVHLAKAVDAKAIISMTKTGYTAFKISSFRPEAPVFIFSDNKELLSSVNLIWGVTGLYYDEFKTTDETFKDVIRILKEKDYLEAGDVVINTASMPIKEKARTNTIKITLVE